MPLNVCMFVYNGFLNDARVLREALTLKKAGHDVTVLAVLEGTDRQFEEISGIKVRRLPKNPIHYRLFPRLKDSIAPKEAKAPTATGKGGAKGNGGLKGYLKGFLMPVHRFLCYMDFYFKGMAAMKNEEIDVCHSHDLNTLHLGWRLSRIKNAKLVYDSHELYVERNLPEKPSVALKAITKIIERFLIRRADAVITVNESIAEILADRYEIEKPAVVMNAPEKMREAIPAGKSLREALGILDDRKIILYSGSITFGRGLENVIEGLAFLPGFQLVLMGYGPSAYKKSLEKLAASVGVAGLLSFFGPVPPDEVTSYAAGADIGIAPIQNACLSYYLCSPNKVFEYMGAGLPVAGSDFPELRRIIEGHSIGAVFEPEDPEDIARAIKQICEDTEKMSIMRANSVKAAGIYNWENESLKLLDVYGRLS